MYIKCPKCSTRYSHFETHKCNPAKQPTDADVLKTLKQAIQTTNIQPQKPAQPPKPPAAPKPPQNQKPAQKASQYGNTPIMLRLDKTTLDKLDKARADISRQDFIRKLI